MGQDISTAFLSKEDREARRLFAKPYKPKWGLFNEEIALLEGDDWKITLVRDILILTKCSINTDNENSDEVNRAEQQRINLNALCAEIPYSLKSRQLRLVDTNIPDWFVPTEQILDCGKDWVLTHHGEDIVISWRENEASLCRQNLSERAREMQQKVAEMEHLFNDMPAKKARAIFRQAREEMRRERN